jgi:hypothetical protein
VTIGDERWEKSLKQKVTDALGEALGSDARIQLDDVAPDKVAGLVLSGSFASQTPTERRDHIWKFLDLHLNPFERTRVVFIVTDTPDEYNALQKAAG